MSFTMGTKSKELREIIRFEVSETNDRDSHGKRCAYSMQTTIYGGILLFLIALTTLLYGSYAVGALAGILRRLI